MFSRQQLKRAAALHGEDLKQIAKCRRSHNRLGFAYQVAFVRLFNRGEFQRRTVGSSCRPDRALP